MVAEIIEAALLHDSPFIHQHEGVAKESGFRHIVSDENDRLRELSKNFFEVRLQTRAHQRIERAERLIKQEQLGLEHQRTHEADALPLSARELDGIALEILSTQSA